MDKDIINKLHIANAVEFMKIYMDENSIDLTITSPPYDDLRNYKGYQFEFEEIANELFRITKKGGIVVWVIGDKIKNGNKSLTSFKHALYFQEIGFNVHDVMIYAKKNTPFMRSNAYTNGHEYMFILSKGRPNTFNPTKEPTVRSGMEMLVHNKGPDGKNKKVLKELKKEKTKSNIWYYAVGLGGSTKDKIAFKHPAVFPDNLAQDHILSWSNEGDIVFDPMCGSGTTCKMAALNNRNYIGVDISEEYIKIATTRLKGLKCHVCCEDGYANPPLEANPPIEAKTTFTSHPPIRKFYCGFCNGCLNLGKSARKGHIAGHCSNCGTWHILT